VYLQFKTRLAEAHKARYPLRNVRRALPLNRSVLEKESRVVSGSHRTSVVWRGLVDLCSGCVFIRVVGSRRCSDTVMMQHLLQRPPPSKP
jgi:hypothetical protein